jgi:AraC-like DNA-binding protein
LGKFLQQIRVEAASRELAETEKPGIEIALASGFSQISFFNRVFQRAMKCTPSSYREQIHRQSRPTVAG